MSLLLIIFFLCVLVENSETSDFSYKKLYTIRPLDIYVSNSSIYTLILQKYEKSCWSCNFFSNKVIVKLGFPCLIHSAILGERVCYVFSQWYVLSLPFLSGELTS